MTGSMPTKLKMCTTFELWHLSSNFNKFLSNFWFLAAWWNKINTKLYSNFKSRHSNSPILPLLYFSPHNLQVFFFFFVFFVLIINMHINRMLIKIQESSPEAFKIGKTPELPGPLPPDPLQGIAPGPHPC